MWSTSHGARPAAVSRAVLAGISVVALLAGSAAYLLSRGGSGRPLSSVPPLQRHDHFAEAPPMELQAGQRLRAVIQTDKGDLEFRLHAEDAPIAANSFVVLARQGFYDGLTFHRVVKDFVAQAGDPLESGVGGPGYRIRGEISKTRRFDRPGVLALAGAAPHGQGSQFFVTLKPAPQLDGRFSIIGELISGENALRRLTPRDPGGPGPDSPGDRIKRIDVVVED